ncbi:DUF6602 domain-containing protein [Micromonospora sp. NPDC049559]|uniref:DUF6602 domain-containing protein n=1 Tax=Micromonospora sp. NPDC049559 TaxID=3155923 RepID=UPI0034167793
MAEEKAANLDNFDSGVGVEEIFRDELRELLPKRYAITTGVITDRYGHTAGHCDAVIFNETWFPAVKAPAARDSRRPHLPIEGVYGVVEVKQSLNAKTLDEAMEKLVVCNRLYRPPTPRDRVTENRETGSCTHFISNPLFSAIFAIDVSPRASFQQLIVRFFEINKLLKRREMVHALVSLNHGCVMWGFQNGEESMTARFSDEDLALPIFPGFTRAQQDNSPLYPFVLNLNTHLYRSVLGAEDIVANYGELAVRSVTSRPKGEAWQIWPDNELSSFFRQPCKHNSGTCSHPHTD